MATTAKPKASTAKPTSKPSSKTPAPSTKKTGKTVSLSEDEPSEAIASSAVSPVEMPPPEWTDQDSAIPATDLLSSRLTNIVSEASPPSEEKPNLPEETVHTEAPLVDDSVSTLGLPSFLDVDDPDSPTPKWTIQLFSRNCLLCNRLVETATTDIGKKNKCGVETNPNCPASQTTVVFVGRRQEFVRRYQEARAKKDFDRVNRILNTLNEEPASIRNWVYSQIGLL